MLVSLTTLTEVQHNLLGNLRTDVHSTSKAVDASIGRIGFDWNSTFTTQAAKKYLVSRKPKTVVRVLTSWLQKDQDLDNLPPLRLPWLVDY